MDAKPLAREQACAAITEGGFGYREVVIRINGRGTPWYEDDLEQVLKAAPSGVLLPKVGSPADVLDVADRMHKLGVPESTRIWCMLETPRGALASADILQSHSRVAVAVMGTSDLARDLHAAHTPLRLPLITALGLCLLAARANGVDILDGVSLVLDDDEAFRAACVQSRELGFDGKTLIHPKQIDPCNAAFSPTENQISEAREIIAAYAKAKEANKGVAVVNGRLVEELHVTEARRVLALHEHLSAISAG